MSLDQTNHVAHVCFITFVHVQIATAYLGYDYLLIFQLLLFFDVIVCQHYPVSGEVPYGILYVVDNVASKASSI